MPYIVKVPLSLQLPLSRVSCRDRTVHPAGVPRAAAQRPPRSAGLCRQLQAAQKTGAKVRGLRR